MAGTAISPTPLNPDQIEGTVSPYGTRPLPLRTYSESIGNEISNPQEASGHFRRKSTHPHLNLKSPPAPMSSHTGRSSLITLPEAHDPDLTSRQIRSGSGKLLSPPFTPRNHEGNGEDDPASTAEGSPDVLPYDFSKIDYELDRARVIGRGLWSTVYYGQPITKSPQQPRHDMPSPPITPQRTTELPPVSLYAVKTASRPDAKEIFLQEARTLSTLQRSPHADNHIVRFMGLDKRTDSLVFEGVVGGSLESLPRRLKVMTELERHLELRSVFPKIANDLISGLEFIHAANIVHADIKPANILLDVSEQDQRSLIIRARYIDFSAAFMPGHDSGANAGGTWDYMAPEQLRMQKDLNTPTFASDVWSLGITLLSIIVGGSPYAAACGNNLFMLREAIKSGDPLGFAQMDAVVQKRMAACQDFVDCCKMALQKDRTRRATAGLWKKWIEAQGTN